MRQWKVKLLLSQTLYNQLSKRILLVLRNMQKINLIYQIVLEKLQNLKLKWHRVQMNTMYYWKHPLRMNWR